MAAKKDKTPTSSLLKALDFAMLAQKEVGPIEHRHCVLWGNWLYASDGYVTVGHPIAEDIQAAAHTATLRAALQRCGDSMGVTQLPDALSVRSGPMRARVPCIPIGNMPALAPDAPAGALGDNVRQGFAYCAPLVSDNAQTIMLSSVLMETGVIVGCTKEIVIEYTHGHAVPRVLFPKLSLTRLAKVQSPIIGFGYSESSFTFYFQDGSWLKTQLYNDKYPNYKGVLNKGVEQPNPIPAAFWPAIDALKPFVQAPMFDVYTYENLLTAGINSPQAEVSSYEIDGLKYGTRLALGPLEHVRAFATAIAYGRYDLPVFFYGENVRAGIARLAWDNKEAL